MRASVGFKGKKINFKSISTYLHLDNLATEEVSEEYSLIINISINY